MGVDISFGFLQLEVGVCPSDKIKGSDTLLPLAERWAQVHEKRKPTVKLVVTGGGSAIGISAL
jgi:phosphate transport system substrate-binding protein